jgi:hypothetical protein
MEHSFAPPQPLIDCDAGRRYLGAQRHRRENATLVSPNLSPTRSPYPLPYYHPRTKFSPKFTSVDVDPLITLASTDGEPSLPSSASRHLRHSVPDVIYKHGPRLPSTGCSGATHGSRARFASLPTTVSSFPKIDTECDRLERACGRAPTVHLRVRDDPPPSSPHQPRGNGPPPPLAPKLSHWALVLRIKRALRRDGKDVRDYVEADQIDELFRRDVEERARRERERGRMARMRSGQELSDSEDNTRSCLFFSLLNPGRACAGIDGLPCVFLFADIFGVPLNESVLRAPATAILGGYRHDLPLVVFFCVEELYRTGEHGIIKSPSHQDRTSFQAFIKVASSATFPIGNDTTN